MENLWPVDLITPLLADEGDWCIFEEQTAALYQASRGLVQGEMRRRETTVGRSSYMFVWPAEQPTKGYEFMAVRSEGSAFPLAIEVFHLGETQRVWRARDLKDLKKVLRAIFGHPSTARIIRLLADESVIAKGAVVAEEAQMETNVSIQPTREIPRPIAVGGLINQDGMRFATVNLLGASGFVEKRQLERIVLKPDSKSSAITSLNGKYVVDISFMDSVRLTLTADELKVLQSEGRRSLSSDMSE